jgi:hypothetical protein
VFWVEFHPQKETRERERERKREGGKRERERGRKEGEEREDSYRFGQMPLDGRNFT